MKVVIAIPVYKSRPSDIEIKSLRQVFKILGMYPISLFTFKECNLNAYQVVLKDFTYSVIYFDKKYFQNIAGYNKLLISRIFYKTFNKYDFLLIYQLDCWIFKNEIEYWCNKNYDYVGAPWFTKKNDALIFEGVGNGGLSLRKISSHLRVLNTFSYIKKPGYFIYILMKKLSFKSIIETIIGLTFSNNTLFIFNNFEQNEDRFWGIFACKNFKWFRVPDQEIALKFSIETYPSKFIKKTEDLPFGCHAWNKYELDFWKKYIK
ncbi:hypothetical protein ASU31_12655 [Pedobacter ginsenosidimutans]|uniref:DUF5672 domain-containing protein n=1 Tax=Pedobacter ginsenosidimutans TaxID=687842 RepID=A0A0T5VRL5_9SPHI|nr:DUF5672 family protein [Pedobacter ginsenosidimutans]KRT15829.1 hypothetical protein ASU31_12655 [Pedobacter ginsenosidimutans]